MHGRGSVDMKGGMAAVMAGAAAAAGAGLRGDVIVALVCDEEHESIGAERLAGRDPGRRGDRHRAHGARGVRRPQGVRLARRRDRRRRRPRLAPRPGRRRDRRDGRGARRPLAARRPARRVAPASAARDGLRARLADRGRPGALELPRPLSSSDRAADGSGRDAGRRRGPDRRDRRRRRRALDVRAGALRSRFRRADRGRRPPARLDGAGTRAGHRRQRRLDGRSRPLGRRHPDRRVRPGRRRGACRRGVGRPRARSSACAQVLEAVAREWCA